MTPETRIRHSAEGAGGGFPPPTPACAAFTSPATPVATSPGLDGRGAFDRGTQPHWLDVELAWMDEIERATK